MWVSNKARKKRDSEEEAVKERMPATADELLELRALNDVPTAAITSLPAEAARAGFKEAMPREQLLMLLRKTAAGGQKLKEEFVIERLLMSLPDAEDHHATRAVNVRLATSTLTFLSSGSVRERLEAMYRTLGTETPAAAASGRWGFGGGSSASGGEEAALPKDIPASLLAPVLDALMNAGQVPPEKMVVTEEMGKNAVGIERSWFEIEVSRVYPAKEMIDDLLLAYPATGPAGGEPAGGEPAADRAKGAALEGGSGVDVGGGESGNAGGSSSIGGGEGASEIRADRLSMKPEGALASGGGAASERVDVERFISMMQSSTACVWGECYQIAERRRLLKEAADAEEYARSPPWYRRAYNMVTGSTGGTSLPPPPPPVHAPPEPVAAPAPAPAPPLPAVFLADGKTPAPFISAEGFEGRRDGYVFKMGSEGVGYYMDAKARR